MKMVIGGAYQGKLEYAKKTFRIPDGWVDGASCEPEEILNCRGVWNFHLLIRRMLEKERDTDALIRKLPEENPTIGIILCRDKNNAVVEMTLPEDNSQIFASKYETVLPSKEALQKLLQEQITDEDGGEDE